MEDQKSCSRCKRACSLTEFKKDKRASDGLESACKTCVNACAARYREKNRERLRVEARERYRKDPHKFLARTRKYAIENKEKCTADAKAWRSRNLERARETARRYHAKNRDRILEARRVARQAKAQDGVWRMNNSIRVGLSYFLAGKKKGKKWTYALGYTLDELRLDIESKFKPGMSWKNYGEWHLDHRRPLSSFLVEGPDDPEVRKAWALSNLQPLWRLENLVKGAKYDPVAD